MDKNRMEIFDLYLDNVKEQLYCNASDDYKNNYITYLYSNEDVNNNLNYFKKCFHDGLSAYKSLLFFGDYLNGEFEI